MLKINLLPDEKGRRPQAGFGGGVPNLLLVGVIGSLVLLLSGLFLFHTSEAGEVDAIRSTNARTQSEIDAIKSRVADHQKILDELAEIRRREEAIQQLQSFNKIVCKGAAAQRYADQCAQSQQLATKLGGQLQ